MITRVDCFTEQTYRELCLYECKEWSIVELTDSMNYQQYCKKGKHGEYSTLISRMNCDWRLVIGDIISYSEATGGNTVLVISEEELLQIQEYYNGHTYNEPILRVDEPKILIHSTPLDNLKKIMSDGCLKSWNMVRQSGDVNEKTPIGSALGDPESFRDYIMFGSGVTCELIVASKQQKQIMMDGDMKYQSGARLYFDAQRIANDGLLIRDGFHLKVKDSLCLDRYLLWTATWRNIGLPSRETTPKIFAERADQAFQRRLLHAERISSNC